VEQIGNADHFHYRRDIVIARKVPLARARAVALWLGDAAVVEQAIVGHPYDVTVIVGRPHPVVPQ
jgi:hypothetical protein